MEKQEFKIIRASRWYCKGEDERGGDFIMLVHNNQKMRENLCRI